MKCIGKNLRMIRLSQGLSQENIAKVVSKTQNWVSLVENGKIVPNNYDLEKICNYLNVDEKYLEIKNNVSYEGDEVLILKFANIFDSI